MAKTGVRVAITLACADCKRRNYQSNKSKRNTPDRVELKKVDWPNQQQLTSGTAVVIVACLITGAYLYLNDQVWQYVVEHLLIK